MGIFNRDYMDGGGAMAAWKQSPKSWTAIQILLAANLAVFVGLLIVGLFSPELKREAVNLYLGVSSGNLKSLFVWTPLTSAFTHVGLLHILFNMYIMWSFGKTVEGELGGRSPFILFYVCAGIFASLAHCGVNLVTGDSVPAIGASGAVAGILTLFVVRHPHQTLLLFGVLPMPAYIMLIGFGVFDLYHMSVVLTGGPSTGTAHGAHIGGMLFGFAYYKFLWSKGKILTFERKRSRSSGGRTRSVSQRSNATFVPYNAASTTNSRRPGLTAKEEERMDELLRRVSTAGLDSLSQSDREFLIDMSKKVNK